MNIRKFNLDLDSKSVVKWWEHYENWDKNTIHLISPNGFIVEENNLKIAATWIVKTDTPIYLMEWTVANPEIDWKKRKTALVEVTNYACEWAKSDGAKAVMVMTKSKRYIEKLKESNFIESDKNMTHVVRSF